MRTLGRGKPACARKTRSAASSRLQNRRFVDGLVQRSEVKLSLVIGKDIQKIPRGDIKSICTGKGWEPDDDDVYYYISERLKLEGETENMSVCTKE